MSEARIVTEVVSHPSTRGVSGAPIGEPVTADEQARIGDRYKLMRLLAQGGMGAVYLAQRPGSRGLCVIKTIYPELLENPMAAARFEREGRLAGRMRHPNLLWGIDYQPDMPPFIVYEYVAGVNLREILEAGEGEGLPIGHMLAIADGVLAGLEAAHTLADVDGRPLGLVHRDVSPHNVMLNFGGLPKIIDFGVAHIASSQLTEHGVGFIGKLQYGTPEAVRQRRVDRRTDLYSLGVMLHEMLTGRPVVPLLDHPGAMTEAIVTEDLAPHSRVPVDVFAVLQRACAKSPEGRFGSAAEMRSALARCQPGVARPDARALGVWLEGQFPERHQEIVRLVEWCELEDTLFPRTPEKPAGPRPLDGGREWWRIYVELATLAAAGSVGGVLLGFGRWTTGAVLAALAVAWAATAARMPGYMRVILVGAVVGILMGAILRVLWATVMG